MNSCIWRVEAAKTRRAHRPLLACVWLLSTRQMALQRRGLDAGLGQLLRRARGGSKTFDLVTFGLHSFPDHRQGRCIAGTGNSIQADNLLAAHRNAIDHLALRWTQLCVTVLGRNPQRRRNQHRIAVVALIAALHTSDDLLLHAGHFSSRIERCCTSFNSSNGNELPALHSVRKFLSHLFVGSLRNATADCRLQDASLILHGRAFKDVIASIGDGLSFRLKFRLVRMPRKKLCMVTRLGDNAIRLIAVLCSQFTVPVRYFFWRANLLTMPRAMSRNLCRARAFSSNLLQVPLDLFSPWTGCIEIVLRIAFDFRLTVFAAVDLIAQCLQSNGSSDRYTLVAYCCDWKRLLSCSARVWPFSRSVILKMTA